MYGNFRNKEDLAIEAFKFNVRNLVSRLNSSINAASRSVDKLYALTSYYRGYYDYSSAIGGCPVLNVGTDAKNMNPSLFRLAQTTSRKLEAGIEQILLDGIDTGELKKSIDTKKTARNIYSMIEGSVFMATTHNNRIYMNNMMDHIDEMIKEKLIS